MGRLSRALRRLRGGRDSIEEFYGQRDVARLREELQQARDSDAIKVSPAQLLLVTTLRTPQCALSRELRALGDEFHQPLLRKWARENPGDRVTATPPQAIVLLSKKDGYDLRISLSPVGAPDFDWSSARALLNRVDAIGELAKLWIADERAAKPHFERAYGLATQVLGAVQRERWRRADVGLGRSDPPSDALARELASIEPKVAEAERLLVDSAEQAAQSNYVDGMLLGGLALVAFAGGGGALLYAFGVPASTAVAFPAGALGAVVSVLQRLTSSSLEIDYRAPAGRTRMFGAIRPWVGAIFGMVVYAILQAEILGVAVEAPSGTGPELAYFAAVGFFAGFNERFAQDVVSSSSSRLGDALAAAPALPPPK